MSLALPAGRSGWTGTNVLRSTRALPIIIALVGLTLSAMLFRILRADQQRQADNVTATAATYLENTLRSGFDQRAGALARTAQRWQLSGGRNRAEFDLEAAVNIQSYPAFRSIGWVDSDLVVRWLYPSAGNEAAVGFDNGRDASRRGALRTAQASGQAALAGPVNLVQGGRGFLLFQPIPPIQDRPQGFIYAAIDPRLMLEAIIGSSEPDRRLRVSVAGEIVLDRPPTQSAGRSADAAPVRELSLRLGQALWRIEIGDRPSGPGPAEILPLTAALLSLGLATVVGGALRGQARSLRLRREIEEGEARFAATFEQAAVGIAHVSPDGHWLRVNERLGKIVGRTREELLALRFQDITDPDDLDNDLDRVRALLAGEIASYQMEKRYVRPDKSLIWVLLTVSLVRDDEGRPDYFISVVEDIEARKKSEALLKDSERRFRALLENSPRAMWVSRPDGSVEYMNRAWRDYTGQSQTVDGLAWVEAIHPEDRLRVATTRTRAIDAEEPYSLEVRIRGVDGSYRWHDSRVAPLHRDGELFAWVGTATDIDAIRRAEIELRRRLAQLASIYRGAPVGLSYQDAEGRFVEINEALAALNGRPVDEHIGRTTREVLPEAADDLEPLHRRVLETGVPILNLELRARTASTSGALRDYLVSYVPGSDEEGRVIGFTTAVLDITDRKHAEEEVRRLNKTLEERVEERTRKLTEVNAELQAFAYSVSHDLRAPLRAMQGFSHALIEDYGDQLDEIGRDYLTRILGGAKQLDDLIQDLLAYSRLSREEVRLSATDLTGVVDNALRQLAGPIKERQARIGVERPLPSVMAQPSVLTQVMVNLISNALKFVAPDQRPQIRIWAEQSGQMCRIWLEDNGIGIAPEHSARIFEVFQRLHGMTEYPGTGIGLAIVRKGVERLGGRVGVESEVGSGSRFWVELKGVLGGDDGGEH